jgi:hypothetical protein
VARRFYRQAMRLFLDGKTEEAIKILDEKKLQEVLAAAIGASPDSFEANFAYGLFNQRLNRQKQDAHTLLWL